MNTSESMIAAAKALKAGAAEDIVALALRADGFSAYKVEVMLRWCALYNQRTEEHEQEEQAELARLKQKYGE
jgi:hypothetical protein